MIISYPFRGSENVQGIKGEILVDGFLKKDVSEYIQICLIYQEVKEEH